MSVWEDGLSWISLRPGLCVEVHLSRPPSSITKIFGIILSIYFDKKEKKKIKESQEGQSGSQKQAFSHEQDVQGRNWLPPHFPTAAP